MASRWQNRWGWRWCAALATALAAVAACSSDDGSGPSGPEPAVSATTPGDPTSTAAATVPPPAPAILAAVCGGAAAVTVTGRLPDDLEEVSGLAASRARPGTIWAIEDSGNPAQIARFDLAGGDVQRVAVDGADNFDWEDLAIGPGPDGRDLLWVADIGDNFEFRRTVTIYRFAEPADGAATVRPARLEVSIEAGPRDAEALAVGASGAWMFEKTSQGPSGVYLLDEESSTFRRVAELDVRPALLTGADLSVDGTALVVRTSQSVLIFPVAGGDVAAAVRGEPCVAPTPPEVQGEAVTFAADGSHLVTVGERGPVTNSIDVHRVGESP